MLRVGAEMGPSSPAPRAHQGSLTLHSFQVIDAQHHELRWEEGCCALTVLK